MYFPAQTYHLGWIQEPFAAEPLRDGSLLIFSDNFKNLPAGFLRVPLSACFSAPFEICSCNAQQKKHLPPPPSPQTHFWCLPVPPRASSSKKPTRPSTFNEIRWPPPRNASSPSSVQTEKNKIALPRLAAGHGIPLLIPIALICSDLLRFLPICFQNKSEEILKTNPKKSEQAPFCRPLLQVPDLWRKKEVLA